MNALFTKFTTLAMLCLVLLTACSDNSSSSDDDTVEGLWKLQSTEGDDYYVNITATTVTEYDFQGDEFDAGEDCYIIFTSEIVERNGDIFTIPDSENPGTTIDVKVTAQNDVLTVEQPTGNGTVTIKYDRFSGNISNFTPECSDEQGAISPKAFNF